MDGWLIGNGWALAHLAAATWQLGGDPVSAFASPSGEKGVGLCAGLFLFLLRLRGGATWDSNFQMMVCPLFRAPDTKVLEFIQAPRPP